jgi:hypothetical protein
MKGHADLIIKAGCCDSIRKKGIHEKIIRYSFNPDRVLRRQI